MLTIFNQKKLASTDSMEETRCITDTLEKQNLEYYVKTLRAGGNAVISGYVDARTVAKVSLYTQTTNSSGGYIYVIYVRKKDWQKASEIMASATLDVR